MKPQLAFKVMRQNAIIYLLLDLLYLTNQKEELHNPKF